MKLTPYILRRTVKYPPDMLYHLCLITHEEYMYLVGHEWDERLLTWDVVAYR